jgi:hypothetical protein
LFIKTTTAFNVLLIYIAARYSIKRIAFINISFHLTDVDDETGQQYEKFHPPNDEKKERKVLPRSDLTHTAASHIQTSILVLNKLCFLFTFPQ